MNAQKIKVPQPLSTSVTFRAVDTEVRKVNDLDPHWVDSHRYFVLLPADFGTIIF
jgi:hypothetical protein